MNRIDAMIAPRALTALELAQVLSPHLIVYGLTHRAMIHNELLQDSTGLGPAVVHVSETALDAIVENGVRSVGEWLADMEVDDMPRFYRKASLDSAVRELCRSAADAFIRQEGTRPVAALAEKITERDHAVLTMLIEGAGKTD